MTVTFVLDFLGLHTHAHKIMHARTHFWNLSNSAKDVQWEYVPLCTHIIDVHKRCTKCTLWCRVLSMPAMIKEELLLHKIRSMIASWADEKKRLTEFFPIPESPLFTHVCIKLSVFFFFSVFGKNVTTVSFLMIGKNITTGVVHCWLKCHYCFLPYE